MFSVGTLNIVPDKYNEFYFFPLSRRQTFQLFWANFWKLFKVSIYFKDQDYSQNA